MNKAWHLRQDGKAFPVKVHMYCMDDEDLSSEAEVAAFIISSKSKDQDIAEYVLDAWMALLIEQEVSYDADEDDIEDTIRQSLGSLPYHFSYPLTDNELISIHKRQNNYSDVDSLYDFIDNVRDNLTKIQSDIKQSMNQQFCRVRYGGQYNTVLGNNEIWFRISSAGYNWVDTIYVFVSSLVRGYKLTHITICRDSESDNRDEDKEDYFYKAKDGTLYKHMPIDEYLEEEHEHSPVFDSVDMNSGVLKTIRELLKRGKTIAESKIYLSSAGVDYQKDIWDYLTKSEIKKHCIISNK